MIIWTISTLEGWHATDVRTRYPGMKWAGFPQCKVVEWRRDLHYINASKIWKVGKDAGLECRLRLNHWIEVLLQIRGIPNGRHTVEARIVGVIRGQRNSLEKVVIFFEDPYCKFPRSFDAFFFCANYRKKVETWPLGSAWSLVLPVAQMI